ncbi:MAG: Npt1/Npt2 family nucleotide transporter [Rickettsiaceae bacterium]|nr:Npt1/Npt2 family nucleotide transporter [Rickettsiaceae bacterium]
MSEFQSSITQLKAKLRDFFWPIHRKELTKFFSMALLMFSVLFNQNILRIIKDSIVISEISAEVTSFVKLYCVTPAAAIFFIFYAKMVNYLSYERIYNYFLMFFVGYFFLFAFVIYPNIEYFQIDPTVARSLMASYPNFKWYISMGAYWSYVIFYVLAELWPNIFYVLLFWQFANEITSTEQAGRFYTLFSLFGNSSLLVVGIIMMNLASKESVLKLFCPGIKDDVLLVEASIAMVVIFAIISSLSIRFITSRILTDPSLYKRAKAERSSTPKLGLIESLKYVSRSHYLWLMLISSASFGLTMNLVEAVWKDRIKMLYPSVNEYAEFNGLFILWTGVAIMFMTVAGNNLMRYKGWFAVAIITPVIIMVTGVMFFILVVFDKDLALIIDPTATITPLMLAVSVGALQNILSKGAKFSIWDTSREMLYIPLDNELKTKGKAAVDVISSKLGKSVSGLIQAILFTLIPAATYSSVAPFFMIVFTLTCILWINSVYKLYNEYKKIS